MIDFWIRSHITPDYYSRGQLSLRSNFISGKYTIFGFVDGKNPESLSKFHKIFHALYDRYGFKFSFLYDDISTSKEIMSKMHFTGEIEPLYAIVSLTTQYVKNYKKMPEKRNYELEDVINFVDSFISSHKDTYVKKSIKSEPLDVDIHYSNFRLKTPEEMKLRKIVGLSFKGACDEEIDVVILLLRGNDEKKKEAKDFFYDIASDFYNQNIRTVKFEYMDLDNNDTPGLKIPNTNESIFILFPKERKEKPNLYLFKKCNHEEKFKFTKWIQQFCSSKPKIKISRYYDEGSLEL